MSHLSDYKFHVGYHAGWTKQYPAPIVNRLKLLLRDQLRSAFTEELMDSWESPRHRGHTAPSATFGDLDLDEDEIALAAAIGTLEHPEHESDAPLTFVRARIAQVNDVQNRCFAAEPSSDCHVVDGCLYCNHTWTKVESFELYENGRRWMLEATDTASNRTVIVPMLAVITYECDLSHP